MTRTVTSIDRPGRGTGWARQLLPHLPYKAAACHYACSLACNQSNSGFRLVTIQCLPSDREASGTGGAGQWPPGRPAGIYHGMYEEADIFIACYISMLNHTFFLLNHTFSLLNHTLLLLHRQKKC
jgi:hypothetical protein